MGKNYDPDFVKSDNKSYQGFTKFANRGRTARGRGFNNDGGHK